MNAVFEQTRVEARQGHSPEPAALRSLIAKLVSLRRHFTSGLARVHRAMTRREAGSRMLADRSALMALGQQRLLEARRARRPLSLAVFEFSDLEEVRAIYGNRMRRAAMAEVVARMAAAVGSRGTVARTGPAQFTLLLPGSDRRKAGQAIHRAMGVPVRVEIESGDHEIVLVPEFQIECAGADVESIEDLYLELCRDLEEAGRFQHDREHYLTRERESHSRAGRPSHPPGDPDRYGPGADIPPTVPVSLSRT